MNKKIIVTGGSGMVGHGFEDFNNIIFLTSKHCDLRNPLEVEFFFKKLVKDYDIEGIIHLAAKVGGVQGNTDYIADFYYDNIMMNTNVLHISHKLGIPKVVSLLSTCVYPYESSFPLIEENIHFGRPHNSNFGYAYAKRMVDVQSRAYRQQYGSNFITAIPNNLYGPHDNFDLENGHVIPAIIRKIWEAKLSGKKPKFWGDGSPLREFTYSQDIAPILIWLFDEYNQGEPINIGNTSECKIKHVVEMASEFLEYDGDVLWDPEKPSGVYRKPSSNQKLIDLGWEREDYTPLEEGLKKTCEWFKKNYPKVRGM